MSKQLHVWFLPTLIPSHGLRGGAAVIFDLLRASTTITRALAAGAERVISCLEPDDARRERDRLISSGLPAERVILGGERGGLRIPGFDLANSPSEYTRGSVGGRTLVFTTTNGTRAIETARAGGASRILIGCFNNQRAVQQALTSEAEVHLICAGTNGEVSLEDVLCAGALVEGLLTHGFNLGSGDQQRIALRLYRSCRSDRMIDGLLESRGGRNLIELGLKPDILDCAATDTTGVVPELVPDGSLRGRSIA